MAGIMAGEMEEETMVMATGGNIITTAMVTTNVAEAMIVITAEMINYFGWMEGMEYGLLLVVTRIPCTNYTN